MKEEKDGIVVIDENTIYEIDTECMECRGYYQGRKREWEQPKKEEWNKRKTNRE